MNGKTLNIIWGLSLVLIGLSALILAGGSLVGPELSETLVRICGGTVLLMLPVLACTTVLKVRNKK